jgi:hypothetical protein
VQSKPPTATARPPAELEARLDPNAPPGRAVRALAALLLDLARRTAAQRTPGQDERREGVVD